MAKRWCGSSALGLVERAANHAFSMVVLGVALSATTQVLVRAEEPTPLAAETPLAEPSPVALDPEFLRLPAHDLERADSAPIRVGDRVKVKINGLTDPATRLALPQGVGAALEDGWAIAELPPGASDALFVVALRPGSVSVPSLAIKDGQGKVFARTHPFNFNVISAIPSSDPKPEEPVPLRPPVSLGFPWWLVVLGAVIAIAVLVAAYFAWKRLRGAKAKAVDKAGPPRPEDEVALEALSALEKENLAFQGKFKKHYFRVSEILKTYIGARYEFDAVESTSREIVMTLEDRMHGALKPSDGVVDRLEALFTTLDRVKFTDHVPVTEEPAQVLEEARRFIFATRRLPPVVTQKGGGGAPS